MTRDNNTNPAVDAARLTAACTDVRKALPDVRALLPEPQGRPRTGVISRHTPNASEPWQGEAAAVYWTIHFGARQLEDTCRINIGLGAHHPPRGGSSPNTNTALRLIADYGSTLTPDALADARRRVESWVTAIGQLTDVDYADTWVPVPRSPGNIPPACPYCHLFTLRMAPRREIVRCFNPPCRDNDARPPVARMERGRLTGDGMLVFADTTVVHYREEVAETA
jgi:hypothetical protein